MCFNKEKFRLSILFPSLFSEIMSNKKVKNSNSQSFATPFFLSCRDLNANVLEIKKKGTLNLITIAKLICFKEKTLLMLYNNFRSIVCVSIYRDILKCFLLNVDSLIKYLSCISNLHTEYLNSGFHKFHLNGFLIIWH